MKERTSAEIQTLREQVAEIGAWYHVLDFGDGIVTPGAFEMSRYLEHYPLPEDMSGMRVLDVGASNGFFSIEFDRRGADEVIAIDLPCWGDHDWTPRQRRVLEKRSQAEAEQVDGSLFGRPLELAIRESGCRNVQRRELRIYDIAPERLGEFDLVFCGSMLMHVQDPLAGLHAIRSVTKPGGRLVLSSSTYAEENPDPVAAFVGEWDQSNFWQLNPACALRMIRMADFVPEGDGVLYDQRAATADFTDRIFVCSGRPSE